MTVSTSKELTAYTASSVHDAPTLLPERMANFVTAASLAARLSIRCSSLFVEAFFEAAKYGTVLSLGVSRHAITNALATAKRINALTYPTSPSSEPERLVSFIFFLFCFFGRRICVKCTIFVS